MKGLFSFLNVLFIAMIFAAEESEASRLTVVDIIVDAAVSNPDYGKDISDR